MPSVLNISIQFLDPAPSFHGKRDGGEPEWPPSPLRLFQSLLDAAASRWRDPKTFMDRVKPAFEWLQDKQPFEIVTPGHLVGTPFRIAVPNNDLDSPARDWSQGKEPIKPHRPIDLKTMKSLHPIRLLGSEAEKGIIHFLYSLPDGVCPHIEFLTASARSLTHLGWGVDMAFGEVSIISVADASRLQGVRWRKSTTGGTPLRTPRDGTLDDLIRKHREFLGRITADGFRPVPPLRVFDVVRYRRQDEPEARPYRAFELRTADGDRFRYPHRRLMHLAGMVRHLAIEAMKKDSPRDADEDWVKRYVAGHRAIGGAAGGVADESSDDTAWQHGQLSYVPLPSVGHAHADPGVRRLMIVAPTGDDAWLAHIARRLAGQILKPENGNEFAGRQPPLLIPLRRDNVIDHYTKPANEWYSFTPVILPGHDDHKPAKTRSLIERALCQSGVDQSCEFEWSPFSRYRKSFSAHKYGQTKEPQGYFRPIYLLSQTAIHLTLRFDSGAEVPGPITIGAGRHCGFGLMCNY